jgi:hypothetical protein
LTTNTETHGQSGAFESTMRTIPIPRSLPSEPIGLGQLVKGATRSVGLHPCASCERRAQRLDRWVSFGSVRADRRSVVVFAVVGVSAVGGAAGGGMLGRRVGSAVGTRLRDKLRDRGTPPERLDSVVGYAEKTGMVVGSVVGGTVAVLVVLTLANRIPIINPAPRPVGIATSRPIIDDLPQLPRGPINCKINYERCRRKALRDYIERVFRCPAVSITSRCEDQAKDSYDKALAECDRLYLCGSSEVCCGGECHCGTCGNVCSDSAICENGACTCPPGKNKCGYPIICCEPGMDCLNCPQDQKWRCHLPGSASPCPSGPPKQ